jgi:hypothetical protein
MKRFLLLALFLLLAAPFSVAQSGKPNMIIEKALYDAGEVIRTGAPIEHVFRVKNAGDADLNILEVKPG